jgi:hypothetical protein
MLLKDFNQEKIELSKIFAFENGFLNLNFQNFPANHDQVKALRELCEASSC